MIAGVKGKIIDDKGISIPYTTVIITDIDGKSLSPAVGVVADANGNYSIGVSKDNKKLGTHLTAKSMGYKKVTLPIDFNQTDLNINMSELSEVLNTVVVTASKAKYNCEKKGGVWDDVTKSCKLPIITKDEISWFNKNKWFILSAGLFLGAIVATVILLNKKK
jgi:hypothetical protein